MDNTRIIRGLHTIYNICIDHGECNSCPFYGKGFCCIEDMFDSTTISFMQQNNRFKTLTEIVFRPLKEYCDERNCDTCHFYAYDEQYGHHDCIFNSSPNYWDKDVIDTFKE